MVTLAGICFCTALEVCAILETTGIVLIGDHMNLTSTSPRVELLLPSHHVLNLDNSQHRMAIECKNGVIWVTCAGEYQDHILRPGRRFVPKTKGMVVIEAIDDARLDVEEKI